MQDRKLASSVVKGMVLLLLAMLACKYTKGGGAALIALVTFMMAVTGRIGWALIGYCLFPFMVVMNPHILPRTGLTALILRLAPMAITVVLLTSGASRQGRHQIPLGMMYLYLFVACICSINGYYPTISYLKVVNCLILFLGLSLGFRNIDQRPQEVITVRQFFLVITAFIVFGSLMMWLVMPGAAYMTTVHEIIEEEGMEAANAAVRAMSGKKLFAGVTNQSQCLATVLPCSLAWLACDMFFIEKRISKFHVATILSGLPLVYLTRSRSALLTSMMAALFIYFYCLKRVNIRQSVKRKMHSAMMALGVLVAIGMGVMEARNHAISAWLRKTDDVAGDARGLGEAFTSSRMGKVEENMADFKRNPIMGTGFQVTYAMKYQFRNHKGLILSASLEKSILPLMVLGETGIVGGLVFLIFIISFYAGCIKNRYYCCATLHTVFLVTNMAESTYFSPGGAGGYMWVLCVGGGFVVDMVALYHRRMESIARQQQLNIAFGGGGLPMR